MSDTCDSGAAGRPMMRLAASLLALTAGFGRAVLTVFAVPLAADIVAAITRRPDINPLPQQ